ncbi:signal peptidase I [Bilifractor sp. LCP19S3_H10]|uniref:signal peptidase I n=1 Tax=Bilifractor sp. LCP19S3_H10 TaxID=3438736 RepID=UPI003F910A08
MGMRIKKLIGRVITLLLYAVTIIVLFGVIFGIHPVNQTSMRPSISGVVVTNKLAYSVRNPKRGDIVVFRKDGQDVIKRIIGLPGDQITIWGGKVLINDKLLDEPYLPSSVITDGNTSYEVPSGMYFVMGDNREESYDSRYYPDPYVNRKNIEGRVFYCLPSITEFPGKIIVRYKTTEK